MKLVPITREEYDRIFRTNRRGSNIELIEEFCNMEIECAEVQIPEGRNAGQVVSSLNASIKRCNRNSIKARTVNGKVYLINTNFKGKKL